MSWTLNKKTKLNNIEAFEMQCYWKSMKVLYTDHLNAEVLESIDQDRALM